MFKILFLIINLALISGCSSSDDNLPTVPALTIPTITIDAVGSTTTVNESGIYNLTISGTGNTVTLSKDNLIDVLLISGVSNQLTIEPDVLIDSFNVEGTGNTVIVPINSGIGFTDSGVGNSLIEQ